MVVQAGHVMLEHRPDLLARAEPCICAFDIETTKLPLQFPNAEYDQVNPKCSLNLLVRLKTALWSVCH